MIILFIALCALVIVLSVMCYRWSNRAHRLLLENRRLELELEKAGLIINEASAEAIREVTMDIIDFDRKHYGQLYKSRNTK